MANIGAIDDETFQATVLDSDIPVLLDFWAEWCTPCKLVSPVVEEIGDEQGNALKVATINVDENPAVTRQYGVLSIPSLILFKGGQEVARVVGAKPKEAILRDLGAHLSADA
jgi:thioredoxin 1